MKIKKLFFAMLFVFGALLCAMPGMKASAYTYQKVKLDSLSKYERFYAYMNGGQYKDDYYFLCENYIYCYSNDLDYFDKVPEWYVRQSVDDFYISGKYLVYQIYGSIYVKDLDSSKKAVCVVSGADSIVSVDGETITYYEEDSETPVTIDMKGKKVKAKSETIPAFSLKSDIKDSVVFKSDGKYYAGVKYKSGKYGLYIYNGKKYKLIKDKLSVDTTHYYMLADKAYFLKESKKGKSTLYSVSDKGPVKAGEYDLSAVLGRESGTSEFEAREKYLILIYTDEKSGIREYYIFNSRFKLLTDYKIEIGKYDTFDKTIIFEIRNGNLLIDYEYWDYDKSDRTVPTCPKDKLHKKLKAVYENLNDDAKKYVDVWYNQYQWDKKFSVVPLDQLAPEEDGEAEAGTVKFGHDKKGNSLYWKVIDEKDDMLLLISSKSVKYAGMVEDADEHFGYWKASNARSWLNKTFYKGYFDDSEKKYIVKSTINNTKRDTEKAYNENTTGNLADTEDYFFLLSVSEMKKYDSVLPSIDGWFWLRDAGMYEGPLFGYAATNGKSRYTYGEEFADEECMYYPAVWVKKEAF